MRKDTYHAPKDEIIKIQRSMLYNPAVGHLFIIELKYKLAIYEYGSKERYDINDVMLSDMDKMNALYQFIQDRAAAL